ncbi:hypothetical protein [Cyanobium sp. Lug-B]|uniref:hypothetical protein n=1 Tax=Cyanobium sp. Lug-B TaxID=2823716 RepID=UPI0020CC05CF|nr:hypothetical protein [Cyanobium sp. Lug-B]MCP9798907.1 hypothetical protein [Cyanobium sp. Lug-B]
MFSLDVRAGRLTIALAIDWERPEPDDGPPSPVPHLQPLEPLLIDDDGDDVEDGGLGFRG